MPNDKYINKDTYQTIQKVEVQSDFGAAIKPLWKKQDDTEKKKQNIHKKLWSVHLFIVMCLYITHKLYWNFNKNALKRKLV